MLRQAFGQAEEMSEDSPIYTLSRIVIQQVLGFPWYLFRNITSSQGALARPETNRLLSKSHFAPWSSLFRPEEWHLIILSDIGIGITVAGLAFAAHHVGWKMVILLYVQPYLWVNHWVVAVTYLHHTHPDVPKYEDEAWSFLKGATATIDRDFGWAGRYLLHNVIEYHVIHHLFP